MIRRPFTGFEREAATYDQHKSALLVRSEGRFVVIVGDQIEGPFETREEALAAGYRRFGLGPLFVKQVVADEPVVEVRRADTPCPS